MDRSEGSEADAAGAQANSLIRSGAAQLAEAGVGSPTVDATALLAHAWGSAVGQVRRLSIVGAVVPPEVASRYAALLCERAARVPLQHLTGTASFRHLELAVGPGVFTPRPETELLVDHVLRALASAADGSAFTRAPRIVDLCTGSGAIALAIKQECPDAEVYAVELSPDAHAWAELNRDRTGLDVDIRLGPAQEAFPELTGAVDVVASNPPYIPDDMVPVDPEVRDHDPEVALYGGSADGLRIPLEVAARAAQLLRPGGVLVMEHADTQGDSLPEALRRTGDWAEVSDAVDLAGRARHTLAVRAG